MCFLNTQLLCHTKRNQLMKLRAQQTHPAICPVSRKTSAVLNWESAVCWRVDILSYARSKVAFKNNIHSLLFRLSVVIETITESPSYHQVIQKTKKKKSLIEFFLFISFLSFDVHWGCWFSFCPRLLKSTRLYWFKAVVHMNHGLCQRLLLTASGRSWAVGVGGPRLRGPTLPSRPSLLQHLSTTQWTERESPTQPFLENRQQLMIVIEQIFR